MVIDNIKISQEINFNGLPTWVSIGATMLPDDNEKDCLRQLQKSITDYHTEEAAKYNQSKWNKPVQKNNENPAHSMIQAITTCTEVATLKTFEKLAKSKPEFEKAYNLTLEKLTNGL